VKDNLSIQGSTALVDFSHMLTVAFKVLSADAKRSAAQVGVDTTNMVIGQLNAIRSASDHVVVCLDSPPYWRKKLYPEYKGKRAEREPEFAAILNSALERIEKDGYQIARAKECEADDVIATLACIYSEQYGCSDVRIVGADKDALQCVSDSVRLFVPKERGEFDIRGPDWLLKEFAVAPKDFALLLAIMGDTSDNIPGIKGLGKGHGAKLIELYKNPAGMAVGLTAAVNDARLNGKELSAVWKRFAAGMAELPKWWKLTTLDTNCVLDKHPLKYLEKLPMQPLVENEISDADDSGFGPEDFGGSDEPDWERIERETAERERAELAKALPVDKVEHIASRHPTVPRESIQEMVDAQARRAEPRIGKDPNADKVLREAASELERMKNDARARIASGETDPVTGKVKGFSRLDERDKLDRHGQPRPDPTVMDAPVPKASTTVQAAPSQPVTSSSPVDSPAAASAPTSSNGAASQVVPNTQGPQTEKLAVVPFAAPSWELATQPRSPSEMAIVAARFYNSRFYGAHGNADGTFAVIALGRELGLGAAASVEGFHIVNQRPFAKAVMLKALAERDPNCEWLMVTSADDKQCTIETKHRKIDKVLSYTYTIQRAEQAGYLSGKNRENWITKTQEMLESRATSKAVRRWYPGATFGMHSVEESGDD
jgi:5'-3' exonuclease